MSARNGGHRPVQTDLAGSVLGTQDVDNGNTVSLNDDGTEDRSQVVTHPWQYEVPSLPGRPVSVTEQFIGEAALTRAHYVYADHHGCKRQPDAGDIRRGGPAVRLLAQPASFEAAITG
ncbi:hypothetical protein [Pantoea sp. AS142]|uniref:hypothetical protein n=1 Tax=Pantoea sp. AS142 TaxID=3081292 RepID=UPI0030186F1A